MKKLLTILFFLAFSGILFAQIYPLVTIEEIQASSPSPFIGDTVRVQGLTMARVLVDPQSDRRPILWAGSRWQTYLYDPNGQTLPNRDGLIAIQHDTTITGQATFFDLVDSAQVIEVTGVVSAFNQTTQLNVLMEPVPIPIQIISQEPSRTPPIELAITDFMNNGTLVPEAEQYQSMYVILRDVITSDRNLTDGSFRINDGLGNYMTMYDQSGYFTLRGHRLTGITDYQPPVDGTFINFFQELIQVRTTGYYIIPIYPGDINITFTLPSITEVRRDEAEVMSGQSVEVTANIIDLDGTVEEAKIFYRVDGGAYNEVAMTQDVSDTTKYSTTIPGVTSDSSIVNYYIWALDNEGRESTSPGDINNIQYFYLVLNRNVTIQDVQYNPFGSDVSGYNHYYVALTGTVTADTSDFPGTGMTAYQIIMQNGEGPWSGIRIGTRGSLSNDVSALSKGDNVTVTGYVWDDPVTPTFNVTRIDSVINLVINSTGNALPGYMDLETIVIGEGGLGEVEKEQWESVLIRYNSLLVTDENADGDPSPNYGEMLVDDGSGDTRVELEDGNHSYHNLSDPLRTYYVMTGSTFDAISGVMYYSHGNYKLVPRNDDDFVGFVTDVTEGGEIPKEYSLSQNYPNPFNPSTTIQYSLPEAGDVTVRIYNLLGQEVKTVFNNVSQSAGTHKVVFSASELPSGIYFYSFRVNDFVQVKKMILMK